MTIKYAATNGKEQAKKMGVDFGFKTYREYEKAIEIHTALAAQYVEDVKLTIDNLLWLIEKFGDGVYTDVLGLCKCASRDEIADKGYSLTPGAYVGVKPVEEDGVDFNERMAEIHAELLNLQAEGNELMATISKNLEEFIK